MQPVIIISRSIVMVTPDELKENGSNLVVGMKHDAELNRQALLNAEELCATRASLAEQRALATAVADRVEALARALASREGRTALFDGRGSSGGQAALGTGLQPEA